MLATCLTVVLHCCVVNCYTSVRTRGAARLVSVTNEGAEGKGACQCPRGASD